MKTDGWIKCHLRDIIYIKHGFAFKGEYFKDSPPGEILLTPGNFAIGGGFKGDKYKYYKGPVPGDFVLNEGNLLIAMTDLSKNGDMLGYPAIVPRSDQGKFLHNQRLGKVIIKDESVVTIEFLNYLLRTREYRHEVLSSATGSTVRHTSPDRIGAYEFLLPPIAEQRKIANLLGCLDDKIELNRRMNETLEAIARTIFKSWFIDFDPVRAKAEGEQPFGMDEETAALFPSEFEDSELGEIPKGWEIGTVEKEYKLTMGQSPPGSTYNEEGKGTQFFQGRTDFGFRYPKPRVYCIAPTRFAEPGDTLVSVRAPVGDVSMAKTRCCVGRGLAALRHKSGSRSYTFYSMKALHRGFSLFESEGTVFGCINKQGFSSLKIVIPPDELVAKFESLVAPMDQGIENNINQNKSLTDIRDMLLPKLLSGEIRVPVEAD